MAHRTRKRIASRWITGPMLWGAAIGSLLSCSLGLDASLIDKANEEAGIDGSTDFEASAEDAGDGARPQPKPEAGICAKDEDCQGTEGCLTAKCDVPRGACVFNVCRPSACNSSECNVGAATCAVPKTYPYRAAQFPVGAAIGCGGAFQDCFAVVYPFVFVGTSQGVVVFAAHDPQSATPTAVPLTGLAFLPTKIVASGSRVYFLGAPVVATPAARLPLAYVDVPADPFASKLSAKTVLGFHKHPATDPLALLARGKDTALLVDVNVSTSFASASIEPPLNEPAVLESHGVPFTAGSVPVAVSGSRLIMAQTGPDLVSKFGFVAEAGTATPTATPDVPITTATPSGGPHFFAQSADGAVFWAHGSVPPPPPTTPVTSTAKGFFLVPHSTAAFDLTGGIALETYPNLPRGTPMVGPAAMLDAKTAMVTTAVVGTPTESNVRFLTREPLALVRNGDGQPRRFQLGVSVDRLAAAASNGLGYILAVDPKTPAAPIVHVFDPACAP